MANYNFKFTNITWKNNYQLKPFKIIDSATDFRKNSYKSGTLTCLSFHHRKHLPIGRGGMILTDSKTYYKKLKLLRYDGRNIKVKYDNDKFTTMGYHMYMTPEQAAYGLKLFEKNHKKKQNEVSYLDYSDLRKYKKIFK